MAKMVGLSRTIKLPWLNKAASLYEENLSKDDFKTQMNEYLSFEIDSPTVLRKTREILMNVWYYELDDTIIETRKTASLLLKQYPEDTVAIHWCLLLLAYPILVDLSKLIGRLSDFGDEITLKQIKQKLFDEWGERSTLFHTTNKIIATIKALGIFTSSKVGYYTIVYQTINHESVVNYLIHTALKIDGNSYHEFSSLTDLKVLFPFKYSVTKEQILSDERFVMTNFGGELTVSVKQ